MARSGVKLIGGAAAVLIGAGVVYSTTSPTPPGERTDSDEPVIVRGVVESTSYVDMIFTSESDVKGRRVHVDTPMQVSHAGDVVVDPGETVTFVLTGSVDDVNQRTTVTCKILVNGKERLHRSVVARPDDADEAITTCKYTVKN